MNEELRIHFERSDEIVEELTKSMIKLIKDSGIEDINYGIGMGSLFANILNEFDYRYDDNDNKVKGIGSLSESMNKHHIKFIIDEEIPNIQMLYKFLVDNNHTEDNKYDIGYGDRYMNYIDAPYSEFNIIYYENQNIKFLVYLSKSKSLLSSGIHIRKVYDNIIGSEEEEEFRQKLKSDNGLEYAMINLTHRDSNYSNSVNGNRFPDKFSVDDIKKSGFNENVNNGTVLRYGDVRDNGYLLSHSHMSDSVFTKDTKYVWDELLSGVSCITDEYKTLYNREMELEKLDE